MKGFVLPLCSWWRFQETDTLAEVQWLISSPRAELVEFQLANEPKPRRVRLRKFLADFRRVA